MDVIDHTRCIVVFVSMATVLAALPTIGVASELVVDANGGGQYETIQAAIDAANPCDTVTVLSGIYTENIDFSGKDLLVRGIGATIDGGRAGPCVSFQSGETSAAVLDGFTLTNGLAVPPQLGGGVNIASASPTIIRNTIVGNESVNAGGGIGMSIDPEYRGGVVIEGNIITNNVTGTNGGGIGLIASGDCRINRNTISHNSAQSDGGGVWLFVGLGEVTISENVVVSNDADDHGGGVLVSINGADLDHYVDIVGNVIARNSAELKSSRPPVGCGVYLVSVTGRFANNTVVGNLGADEVGRGLGIPIGSNTLIERNIFSGHSGLSVLDCGEGGTVIRNNLSWDGSPSGSGECVGWTGTEGNIVADPLFCDPDNGDYTVAWGSPALLHPSGPIGAYDTGSCVSTPVEATTWGQLKSKYRSGTP